MRAIAGLESMVRTAAVATARRLAAAWFEMWRTAALAAARRPADDRMALARTAALATARRLAVGPATSVDVSSGPGRVARVDVGLGLAELADVELVGLASGLWLAELADVELVGLAARLGLS